jgi:hypothetical protein
MGKNLLPALHIGDGGGLQLNLQSQANGNLGLIHDLHRLIKI